MLKPLCGMLKPLCGMLKPLRGMLKPLRALSPKGWIALGLYAVAFGLLSRGGWARDLWLVAIAIGLLVAAAVLLQLALKDAAERARRLVPVLIFAGGAAALAVWWIGLRRGSRARSTPRRQTR
jgi:hypothetical protein